MKTIYLFRHGMPEGDACLRYLGRSDPILNEKGREQARLIPGMLKKNLDANIHSSTLRRALETAQTAFPNSDIRLEPLAVEMNYGVLDGLLPETAQILYPEARKHLEKNPLDAGAFGGESWHDLNKRAYRLLKTITEGETTILITHYFMLLAIVSLLTTGREEDVPRLVVGYGEGVRLESINGYSYSCSILSPRDRMRR